MSKKAKDILLILCIVCILAYLSVTALTDLTNSKELQTVKLDGAVEILELNHTINGLIPIGTDHYYLGFTEETQEAYVIRAPKKWLSKNFDSNGGAIESEGVELTSLAKKVTDYDLEKELSYRIAAIDGISYPLGTNYYLDGMYKKNAIYKLTIVGLIAILSLLGIYIFHNLDRINRNLLRVYAVAVFVTLLLCIKIFAII